MQIQELESGSDSEDPPGKETTLRTTPARSSTLTPDYSQSQLNKKKSSEFDSEEFSCRARQTQKERENERL